MAKKKQKAELFPAEVYATGVSNALATLGDLVFVENEQEAQLDAINADGKGAYGVYALVKVREVEVRVVND